MVDLGPRTRGRSARAQARASELIRAYVSSSTRAIAYHRAAGYLTHHRELDLDILVLARHGEFDLDILHVVLARHSELDLDILVLARHGELDLDILVRAWHGELHLDILVRARMVSSKVSNL